MISTKDSWRKIVEVSNHPQSADYTRLAKRSALTIAGFTIIEVLIVLAIAGLILLIVFLAVPTLQRNSRNNARKQEASRVAAAIEDFVSSDGYLPGTVSGVWDATGNTWHADCQTIGNDVGKLSEYGDSTGSLSSSYCGTSNTGFANTHFDARSTSSGGDSTATQTTTNMLLLVEEEVCSNTYGQTITMVHGLATQAALIYPVEAGSSVYQACITV